MNHPVLASHPAQGEKNRRPLEIQHQLLTLKQCFRSGHIEMASKDPDRGIKDADSEQDPAAIK